MRPSKLLRLSTEKATTESSLEGRYQPKAVQASPLLRERAGPRSSGGRKRPDEDEPLSHQSNPGGAVPKPTNSSQSQPPGEATVGVSPYLGVLRLGFRQDGDVGVGVFPEGEEVRFSLWRYRRTGRSIGQRPRWDQYLFVDYCREPSVGLEIPDHPYVATELLPRTAKCRSSGDSVRQTVPTTRNRKLDRAGCGDIKRSCWLPRGLM